MNGTRTTVWAGMDLPLAPAQAFETVVDELAIALAQAGMGFEPGAHGHVTQGAHEVGAIVVWKPGEQIVLQWRPADWKSTETMDVTMDVTTDVELRFEQAGDGTRVTVVHQGWGGLIGAPGELAGWFASAVAAPLLRATAPVALGNWLTDRRARRPSGAQARDVYREPIYHYPNFRAILAELAPAAHDYLLEVGCGGGAFLREALQVGCRAAAVDHSPDMVRLAQEVNHDAVASGRLQIRHASADHLPFADGIFTCAVMTGVLGFLPDAVTALREIHRVLDNHGRMIVLGSDPELRGTPAAPEPMASRLRFYDDEQLRQLGAEAGFAKVRVERWNLTFYAIDAGVPEEHLSLFRDAPARFLLAEKG